MDSRKLALAAALISAGTAFAANDQGQYASPTEQNASNAASQSNATQANATAGDSTVRQAQQALKDKGQDPGPIDGIMGPRTESALRTFQSSLGLTASGTLDAQTQAALNGSSTSSASSPASPSPSQDQSAPSNPSGGRSIQSSPSSSSSSGSDTSTPKAQ